MEETKNYDNESEYPVTQERDPYNERTVYDVEKITFKNRRKSEKNKENTWLYAIIRQNYINLTFFDLCKKGGKVYNIKRKVKDSQSQKWGENKRWI